MRGLRLLAPPCLLLLASSSCGRTDPSYWPALGLDAGGAAGRNHQAGAATGGSGVAGGFGGGGASAGTAPSTAGSSPAGGAAGAGGFSVAMRGAPLVFAPTSQELGLSVALASGDPSTLRARIREAGETDWQSLATPGVRAHDLAEWRLSGLRPGTSYEYQIVRDDDALTTLYSGRGVTQRAPGESFGFALVSDTHIGSDLTYSNQGDETILAAVGPELGASLPDFVINLGDMLDFHQFGFNNPPPDGSLTRLGYLNYRETFGSTLGNHAHFGVIGNWDGENGSFTSEEIARSRQQRVLYLPNPGPSTYPEGGASGQDYYAFSWGDALFVVLNVMTYTKAELLLSGGGDPTDWTLGEQQLAWLETTLQNATAKWRLLFIHHAVGGAGGDLANAIYGRGGGLAAHVGEQAKVHQLMLEHGVQVFFYGHDHVFTDIIEEGVHYSAIGNAGAIWTFSGAETGYSRYWEESGWARVDVTPNDLKVRFVAVGGETLFEYSLQ
jgi:hypothetical protein